jgi:PAS domain S-box-containing protein
MRLGLFLSVTGKGSMFDPLRMGKGRIPSIDSERIFSELARLVDVMVTDPEEAVAQVLQSTLDITEGKFSAYNQFDLEHRRIVTCQGCRLPENFRRTGRLAGRVCHEEFIAAGKNEAVCLDLDQTVYRTSDPDIVRHHLKAYIGAPIGPAGNIIGSLAVYDDQPRFFDEIQIHWVHLMARLLFSPAERQRLKQRLQQRKSRDRLLSVLAAKAISMRDNSFLDYFLQTIGNTLIPHAVCILWHDPPSRHFYSHDRHWRSGGIVQSNKTYSDLYRIPVIRDVVEKKQPLFCNDASLINDEITGDFLRKNSVTSFLLLPICNHQAVYGICVLYLQSGSRKWEEEGLDTLMAAMGIIAQWKEGCNISHKLDESQALIYQLFQLSPTSIYQVDLRAGRFVKVNEQMCRATGYSETELLAMKPEDLLTPASRELLHQRLADLAEGRTLSGSVEFEIKTKSGKIEWGHFHIRHLRKGGHIWGANVVVHLITEQKRASEELANYRLRLEALVEERTMELLEANLKLREEVVRRTETTGELRLKSERLKELNTAMRVLLDKRNEDRLRSEENIRVNLVQLIEPYLDRLDSSGLNPEQQQLLDVIRMNLNEVVGSPMPELSAKYYIFSPGELQVANLIRKGRNTKDMARLLNVSPRTIESYRYSIRKKLGLKNKKVNLKTYLSSKE